MNYVVVAKHHVEYEDAAMQLVRYSLVVESNGLRFVDCDASTYFQAKVGSVISLPILPPSPFMVDITERSVDRHPSDIL